MKKVNNSSLPAIIKKERINFEKSEKIEKFNAGPIRLYPGPIFPTQVITEEMVVIKSKPFSEIRIDPAKTTKIYKKM